MSNATTVGIDMVIAVCDKEDHGLPRHPKISCINIGRRQKYNDLFSIGNSINPDGINIVANADIMFSSVDIKKITGIDFTDLVVALSRWDLKKHKKSFTFVEATLHNHSDSQDVWIWKGKINVDGDFELGRAGCDNRIAYEIGKVYNIVNPSRSIKSYHLHLSEIRNYKAKDAVPPPYLRVPTCYYNDKKIKKVLHIGINMEGQSELVNMLSSFGQYIPIDWERIVKASDVIALREIVLEYNKMLKPDLVFMQIQSPNIIDAETVSKLHGFVLNWTGDVRSDVSWYKNLAPYIDATCFTNETDVENFRHEGLNSRFLQIGFEDKIFTKTGNLLTTENTVWEAPDVVFMGNNYKNKFPLSEERYNIAKKLYKTYGNKFLLCGQGWDIPAINLMGQPEKEAMVYRSCKIAINANHFLYKRFSSDRIFRIMGSGAFCLTRWYPNIEKDFIDGEHLRTFRDEDEMIYWINYYLKNEGEREYIAEQGCELVRNKFTWMNNKKIIEQIVSFPSEKKKIEYIESKPMSNEEFMKYLSK
jgi:spore maturation protein CgeB